MPDLYLQQPPDSSFDAADPRRVERSRVADNDDDRDRAELRPSGGTAIRLVQVYDGGNMPTSTPKWFLTHPAALSGSEIEGEAGTINAESTTIPVLVLGGTPHPGDFLTAYAVGGKWVAKAGKRRTGCCQWWCGVDPPTSITVTDSLLLAAGNGPWVLSRMPIDPLLGPDQPCVWKWTGTVRTIGNDKCPPATVPFEVMAGGVDRLGDHVFTWFFSFGGYATHGFDGVCIWACPSGKDPFIPNVASYTPGVSGEITCAGGQPWSQTWTGTINPFTNLVQGGLYGINICSGPIVPKTTTITLSASSVLTADCPHFEECHNCPIPARDLTVSWTNTISGPGSAPLIYTAPNQWRSACANGVIYDILCTGGLAEFKATYFTAGSCPDGTRATCSTLGTSPFRIIRTGLTCGNAFLLTAQPGAGDAVCAALATAGYTSWTVSA